MNVKSKEVKENSTVELVVEVGAQEFEAAINTIYRRQVGRINVPGFRKGKAPRKIIESMYGSGVFYEDAVNEAYPAAYEAAVDAEGIEPVARAEVEILDMSKDGFTFKATVTVKPAVKLGAYKGLTAERDAAPVTEADIDKEMEPLVERATRLEPVERKARKGDTAVIDFEGFDNGVPFEGGKGEGYSLALGSGSFVPGFEDGVIGMKAGEEKDISLTFPENYTPELAGKPVVFHVKVQEVKSPVVPKLDDEFAKDVSEFETLAELRKDLSDRLTARREEEAAHAFEHSLIDQVIDGMTVEIPQPMLDTRTERMTREYAARMGNQGVRLEDYLSMTGTTMEAFQLQMADAARHQILHELALEAVAGAEGLVPADEEIGGEYAKLAEQYGMAEERVRAVVPAEDLKLDLMMKKAAALLVETAAAGKAKKPAAKKAPAKKAAAAEEKAEEKPAAKKPAAKKTSAKKAVSAEEKAGKEPADEKKPAPAKKTTAARKKAEKPAE